MAKPRSFWRRVAGYLDDALWGGVGNPDSVLRLVLGTAAKGSWDSTAAQLFHALGGENSPLYLGVTDERLLIFDDDLRLNSTEPMRLRQELPLSEIASASVDWWFLSFGRLRVLFRDESWIHFAASGMRRRRAQLLRTALTG